MKEHTTPPQPDRKIDGVSKEYIVLEQLVRPLSQITADLVRDAAPVNTLPRINELCTRLLSGDAAAIVVRDPHGIERVLPMTDDRPDLIRLLETYAGNGPWTASTASLDVVEVDRIDDERWPELGRDLAATGCRWVCAAPMVLGTEAVGSLVLFSEQDLALDPAQRTVVQTLADLVTLSLCQESDRARAELLALRALSTFDDRVRYEHAVGMVAGRLGIDAGRAATLLRAHADARDLSVAAISREVTSGTFDWSELDRPA